MTASTVNYLWSIQDVLGQGATACVYKARNKKTGEQVAVKVFNAASYSRSYEVQMREFEMLRKLNHNNIVLLYAVEELASKQKVLVMEYCSGGSLLSLLEEPENAFGLPETEFRIVLQCVVQGMNHLRENGVVHRDIKPGNIMRQVGDDGRSVYKLTDFGAARELNDEEKFLSIYGTEEYLHPDMYERAVLRKPQQKGYGVTVDLWSIGVTFYHAAAGSLPFRPYGGPRKNKSTMVSMFLEEVASQTGMAVESQQLLYLGHELPLEGNMKVVNLPPTSAAQPLLLLGLGPDTNPGLLCREPEIPAIPSRFDVMADYRFSKVMVGVVHQFVRTVRTLHAQRELLLQGYYSYMMKLRRDCEAAMVSITMVTLRLQACLDLEHKIGQYPPEIPSLIENHNKLQLIREHLPMYVGGVQQFQNELEHLLIEQAKLAESLANDKSHQKMKMLLEKISAIHQMYRKDRQTGKLGYNDEQIHKFEKIHLSTCMKRMKTLFREDSVKRYKELLATSSTWSSVLVGIQSRLDDFNSFSNGLLADLEVCNGHLNKALDIVLLSFQPRREAPEPGDTPREKEQMVFRMHHLKEEMEILVRELECNNSVIESLGTVSPASASLKPSSRPCTL
ncbi:unnamed protein product [Gadus morhua 'NCC']